MSNRKVVDLLVERFTSNRLMHPGDPDNDKPPVAVLLPIFRQTPNMPQEYSDLMASTARMLAEAIVHTIETAADAKIVDRIEVEELRSEAAGSEGSGHPLATPVHCHCDRKRTDPLFYLTITNTDRIVVPAKGLISELSSRKPECPHERVTH